jgi:hypothetical protein
MLALYNRYAAIVSRIRAIDRERVATPRGSFGSNLGGLDVRELEYQTQQLLIRASLVRRAIGCLLGSMTAYALHGMLAVIAADRVPASAASSAAQDAIQGTNHGLLVLGLLLTGGASLSAAYELLLSLKTIEHEAQAVRELA